MAPHNTNSRVEMSYPCSLLIQTSTSCNHQISVRLSNDLSFWHMKTQFIAYLKM